MKPNNMVLKINFGFILRNSDTICNKSSSSFLFVTIVFPYEKPWPNNYHYQENCNTIPLAIFREFEHRTWHPKHI